jgi:hypothetical protein
MFARRYAAEGTYRHIAAKPRHRFPLRALAPFTQHRNSRVHERCRTCADGMEIALPAGFTRPCWKPHAAGSCLCAEWVRVWVIYQGLCISYAATLAAISPYAELFQDQDERLSLAERRITVDMCQPRVCTRGGGYLTESGS